MNYVLNQVAEHVADERARLEAEHGQVWDTGQLKDDYVVNGFLAPYVDVTRKSDNARGTLTFQHMPRFYFSFVKDGAR